MNHGSTSASTQTAPIAGFNRNSHAAERSVTASATIARPAIITISGPLIEDAERHRGPENGGGRQRVSVDAALALAGEIGTRHRAHRGDDGEAEHRVGLGEPRLDPEQDRCRHDEPGEERGAPRHEGERGPIGPEHDADRADERGDAVEPDAQARLRQPRRLGEFDHGGLEPIDADRLLVTGLVLEADVDEIAGFDHLLGRLGEPRLVAVDRRDMEEPRQESEERHHNQHDDGARIGSGRKIHRARGPGVAITSARLRLADDRHSSPRRPAPRPCSEPAGKCESLQPVRADLSRFDCGPARPSR